MRFILETNMEGVARLPANLSSAIANRHKAILDFLQQLLIDGNSSASHNPLAFSHGRTRYRAVTQVIRCSL
jgi:hypothetical protein